MEGKYSIAFIPPPHIIQLFDDMKDQLFEKIEWFKSRNSKAHITIIEFYASEEQLQKIIEKIQKIADSIISVDVTFDHFDSFLNGAFFVGPNEDSKRKLSQIMKAFHEVVKTVKDAKKSSNPHISIGRHIEDEKLKIAFEIFKEINFTFHCDSVSLREFNGRQYDIKESYPFNGNPSEAIVQTSLF